ncbi:MAG: PhzF family phenazine biosynthesis protein, partial [Acidimicrobiia bacterium]
MLPQLSLYSAFTDTPDGGNPAGVWVGEVLPAVDEMQRIAAEVGFSETAFLAKSDDGTWTTRYYSPEAEVAFCGHATIASGVVLADLHGPGTFALNTAVGHVPVEVHKDSSGRSFASLISVEPTHEPVPPGVLDSALHALGWDMSAIDEAIRPAFAFAGAWHLVISVREHATLQQLEYEFDDLKALMAAHDLTTLQLVWRQDETTFHSRNPFPPGGVVEDPATGASAAALGGYLRAIGAVAPPVDILIYQGADMGRPSTIHVH